jgi:hypothetical protein
MIHLRVVATCFAFACLAGCGRSRGESSAKNNEEAIDAKDPLYAVAAGRPAPTLYGMKGDILVARKAGGRFFLDSIPWHDDFSFRPGRLAPTDPAEAARLREFRIRELTAAEWNELRQIVTKNNLFDRPSAAAGPPGPEPKVLICGARSVLLDWGDTPDGRSHADEIYHTLMRFSIVDGEYWCAPPEPLPPDAVEKILSVSLGESHFEVGGGGSAWSMEASRDKDGAWIALSEESQGSVGGDDLGSVEIDQAPVTRRFRLTDDEWKELLEFIRKEDLLHWTPPHIRAYDGGDSFVTIRTVVDLRFNWSLGLDQGAKAAALAGELQQLYRRHAAAPK